MPEMRFFIRWPDGRRDRCYSPSLVIKDFFTPGESYPLADFLRRARSALEIASDRVAAKYGTPCGRALNQLDAIEAAGRAFAAQSGACVTVEAFEE